MLVSGVITLSREKVMCSLAPISSLGKFLDSWKADSKFSTRNVVAIRRKEDFKEFNEIVKRHSINGVPLFLIFLNRIENMIKVYSSLMSNSLNLNFDSRLRVKFFNDSVIKEMYSTCHNKVQLHNYADWSYESGIKKFSNKTLFIRRNSLEGCPLRIGFVIVSWS